MRGSIVRLFVVWLLLATSFAHAQTSGLDTVATMDTTLVAETTGWRFAPRMRGMHAAAMTTGAWYTLGISADVDILRNSASRPPLSLGVRVGFEDGASEGIGGTSFVDYYSEFTMVDLLARLSIGGRSAEWSVYCGGAWIRSYEGGWDSFRERRAILPKLGTEIRWMFIPKYAGVVIRVSTTTNQLLSTDSTGGGPSGFTQATGGIGFILGWEP